METPLKKAILLWTIVLALTTAFMLFLLLTGQTSLNVSFIFFLAVIEFLSGFGLATGITSLVIWFLTKFETQFQGKDRSKRILYFTYFILLLFIVLLVYYGPIKIYESITQGGNNDSIVDELLYLYGISL